MMSPRAMDSRVELDREYEGTTETLRQARSEVDGWLAAHHLGSDVRERAELVVSELASNAVQAAPGAPYRVRVTLDSEDAVVIALTSEGSDEGSLPPREQWGPSTVLAETGRGLLIVDRLSDSVLVQRPGAGQIVVTATLH
jgi:anti-sigma regulatory factor (Ser/Thr protein kinase)